MHSTRRWVHTGLILTVVVISMSLTVLVLGATRGSENNYGQTGSVAPEFYLRDTDNNLITLDDKSKNVYAIIFSGHSEVVNNCIPTINKLLDLYSKEKDVEILGISNTGSLSIIGPGETRRSALQDNCPDLRLAIDAEGSVSRAYRVNGNPQLIIIDKNHVIRSRLQLNIEGAALSAAELIESVRTTESAVNSFNTPTINSMRP